MKNTEKQLAIQADAWSLYMSPDGAAPGVRYSQYLRIEDLHKIREALGRALWGHELAQMLRVRSEAVQCVVTGTSFLPVMWVQIDDTFIENVRSFGIAVAVERVKHWYGHYFNVPAVGPAGYYSGAPYYYRCDQGPKREMRTYPSLDSKSPLAKQGRAMWRYLFENKKGVSWGLDRDPTERIEDWENAASEMAVAPPIKEERIVEIPLKSVEELVAQAFG